jgi:hypothetical protein
MHNQASPFYNKSANLASQVLVSMPFDVVKTYMQTHGTGMAAAGLRESVAAFWSTGSSMVAKRGPGALFVGLAPRLAHQVPGERCSNVY